MQALGASKFGTQATSPPQVASKKIAKPACKQKAKPPKRGQANKRERVRTENVNAGFDNLRNLIPTDPVDRKLSKIEVLRLATSYISHLYNLTRAGSCAEAESLDRNQRPSKNHKGHICTFCLILSNKPN